MVNEILVQYETLASIARQFSDEAHNVERTTQQVRTQQEAMRSQFWVGDNAVVFNKAMETDVLPALARLSQALHSADHTLRSIMDVYSDAEDMGAAAFKSGDGVASGLAGGAVAGLFKGSGSGDLSSDADGGLNGAPPEETEVLYINGIQNSPADNRATVAELEARTGKRVTGINNTTDGKIQDGFEAAKDYVKQNSSLKALWNRATHPLDALSNDAAMVGKVFKGVTGDLTEALNDLTDAGGYGREDGGNPAVDQAVLQIKNHKGPLEIIAHSQGSAITAAALQRLSHEGFDMSKITVTTLGGAGYDFPTGDYAPKYHHIAHKYDPVTMLNRVAHDNKAANITVVTPDGFGIHHGMDGYIDTMMDYRAKNGL